MTLWYNLSVENSSYESSVAQGQLLDEPFSSRKDVGPGPVFFFNFNIIKRLW